MDLTDAKMEDIRTAIFNGGSGVVRLTAILRLLLQDLMERGNLDPEEGRSTLQRNEKGDSSRLLKKEPSWYFRPFRSTKNQQLKSLFVPESLLQIEFFSSLLGTC
jgi:hypothetical protein